MFNALLTPYRTDRRAQQLPDVAQSMVPATDYDPPVNEHRVDVSRGRSKDSLGRIGTGGAGRVQPQRNQIGSTSRCELPGVGPADAPLPINSECGDKFGWAEPAALLARQPFVHFESPGLLEHVDQHVLIGAECNRAPGVAQGPGRADAVGKIAFGG